MCPMCAVGVAAWMMAGAAGDSAAIATAYVLRKQNIKTSRAVAQKGVSEAAKRPLKLPTKIEKIP